MSDQAENELICERLLGWKRSLAGHCYEVSGERIWDTPTFSTWTDAGLVMEWMKAKGLEIVLARSPRGKGDWRFCIGPPHIRYSYGDTGPLAVRAAALTYLKHAAEVTPSHD